MKKQREPHTPISFKKNNRHKSIGHFSADLSFKNKVTHHSSHGKIENDSIDTRLIDEIFGGPKPKIHEAIADMNDLKYQLSKQKKKSKPKMKSKSCVLSNYKSKITVNKSLQIIKDFIDSVFIGCDDQISLQQVENYLQYFSIIKKSVNEDP